MKNERSIEELLADMLRKQDRQEALLGALVEGQSKIVDVQSKMLDTQERMMDMQEKMMDTQEIMMGTQVKMMDTQVKMAESIVQTNERLGSLNNRFERLIEVLSNNWFQRIIALEDDMEAVKRKVG